MGLRSGNEGVAVMSSASLKACLFIATGQYVQSIVARNPLANSKHIVKP